MGTIFGVALASLILGAPIVWLVRHPRVLMWLVICLVTGFASLVVLAMLQHAVQP